MLTVQEKINKAYLVYFETRESGDIRVGDENSDWPSYEDGNIYFTPKYILIANENSIERAPGLRGDDYISLGWDLNDSWTEAHILVVRYSDGNTFGSINGYWKIIACYQNWSEADKALSDFNPKTYQGYKPWDGYFSSFEDIELHSLTIRQRNE